MSTVKSTHYVRHNIIPLWANRSYVNRGTKEKKWWMNVVNLEEERCVTPTLLQLRHPTASSTAFNDVIAKRSMDLLWSSVTSLTIQGLLGGALCSNAPLWRHCSLHKQNPLGGGLTPIWSPMPTYGGKNLWSLEFLANPAEFLHESTWILKEMLSIDSIVVEIEG